jgi:hypothetical protein
VLSVTAADPPTLSWREKVIVVDVTTIRSGIDCGRLDPDGTATDGVMESTGTDVAPAEAPAAATVAT